MSEPTRTSRAPADKRLTYQQWKRRKMLRLARNWVLFLAGCAAVVVLLTGGILWLLPKVHGLLAGPKVFAASVYDGTGYVFDAADARLTLVNANLPYTAEPAPLLDTADEATGQQLEAEAAMQYRSMAAAAQADGVSLTLVAGYQAADTRQAAYEARVQTYREAQDRGGGRPSGGYYPARCQCKRARHRLRGGYPQRRRPAAGHRLCRDPRL